jgi:pilus assembly protein Flp/PilA
VYTYLRIMLDARLARRDERGASAVEYGLMIGGVAMFLLVVLPAFAKAMEIMYLGTCSQAQGTNC